jgi:hypothetical protein
VWRGAVERGDDAVVVHAGHDGYRRLEDPVEHVRTFCWLPGDGLVVVDRLRARRPHAVRTGLQLAEGVDPARPALRIAAFGPGPEPEARAGRVAPFLGDLRPAPRLERRMTVPPRVPFGWALTRSDARVVAAAGAVRIERPGRPAVMVELPAEG